jgi:hypothetical protein
MEIFSCQNTSTQDNFRKNTDSTQNESLLQNFKNFNPESVLELYIV